MSEKKSFTFTKLPEKIEELKACPGADLKDPYAVAALAIAAFCSFTADKEACYEMINYLKGPEALSGMDKQFISDRFMDGRDYVVRSYFNGTSPDNNYQPEVPYTIQVEDNPYSRDEAGYIKLYVKSSGADSLRPVQLRNKPSTGEWFLWNFSGVLTDIRAPKTADPWA